MSDPDQKYYMVLNITDILREPGFIFQSDNMENKISTEGSKFKDLDTQIDLTPGLPQNVNLDILDELGQPVSMNIAAFVQHSTNFNVASIISDGLQHQIKLTGRERENVMLTLQTLGTIKLSSNVQVKLLRCPPGHKLSQFSCKCDVESYTGMTKCKNNVAYLT